MFCLCFAEWDVVMFVLTCVFVPVCECVCCIMRLCGSFVMYCVMLYGLLLCVWCRWLWLFGVKCACAFWLLSMFSLWVMV